MPFGTIKYRRLIKIIALIVAMLMLGLYIGLPTGMAVVALLPEHTSEGRPPTGFEVVQLTTTDGIHLAAWYAKSENGSVIILFHGAGSGRSSVRDYATMLHNNGFGVLAVNARGYGDSDGHINRLGWQGTLDVGAAVTYLKSHAEGDAIGALGLSMGGEVLLGAASSYPEIQAIVADGATFRSVTEYVALPMNRYLYRNFTHRIFSFMVTLLSGVQQPQPPLLDSMIVAQSTRFLLIAAGNDTTEVDFNTYYHLVIPDRSSVWVIPEVDHTNGYSTFPEAYEQRVARFFSDNLRIHPDPVS